MWYAIGIVIVIATVIGWSICKVSGSISEDERTREDAIKYAKESRNE